MGNHIKPRKNIIKKINNLQTRKAAVKERKPAGKIISDTYEALDGIREERGILCIFEGGFSDIDPIEIPGTEQLFVEKTVYAKKIQGNKKVAIDAIPEEIDIRETFGIFKLKKGNVLPVKRVGFIGRNYPIQFDC